jgi:hypothetical protein
MSQRANKSTLMSDSMPPAAKNRPDRSKDGGPRVSGIGNAATASLLHGESSGKSIPSDVRVRMEQSLGADLSGVRVRDDSSARDAAGSLNAVAFVRDGQIHWGADAPAVDSAEAAPLLAHELAHVVQQRRATVIEDRVSVPGEESEVHADASAGRGLAGQRAVPASTGAVPATQRQGKPEETIDDPTKVTQAEAEVALTAFLQKVVSTQPPQDLRRAQVVKDALNKLVFAGGPAATLVKVDTFVASAPNDPAQMAHQFVSKLPAKINRAAVESLSKMPFIDPRPSKVSRAVDVVKNSGAGTPDKPADPTYVSPEDQANQNKEKLDAIRGTKSPTTYGPGSVDVLRVLRIIEGLKKTTKAPATKPAAPEADTYAAVETAIAKIPKNALVPAEARGKGDDDSFADAQVFAHDLARRLDIAQKSNQDTVMINLGDMYAGVKDRGALREAVEAIIKQIRQALPHHASGVKYVDVRTGKNLLTRGMVGTE